MDSGGFIFRSDVFKLFMEHGYPPVHYSPGLKSGLTFALATRLKDCHNTLHYRGDPKIVDLKTTFLLLKHPFRIQE